MAVIGNHEVAGIGDEWFEAGRMQILGQQVPFLHQFLHNARLQIALLKVALVPQIHFLLECTGQCFLDWGWARKNLKHKSINCLKIQCIPQFSWTFLIGASNDFGPIDLEYKNYIENGKLPASFPSSCGENLARTSDRYGPFVHAGKTCLQGNIVDGKSGFCTYHI